jgi:hypothetical protein
MTVAPVAVSPVARGGRRRLRAWGATPVGRAGWVPRTGELLVVAASSVRRLSGFPWPESDNCHVFPDFSHGFPDRTASALSRNMVGERLVRLPGRLPTRGCPHS